VLHVFWSHALTALPESEKLLQLILLFETRSQYAVYRDGKASLEKFVSEPKMAENSAHLPLDPLHMAASVCAEISKVGQYVVSTVEQWERVDDFVSTEQVDDGNAAEDWLVCVEVSSEEDRGS